MRSKNTSPGLATPDEIQRSDQLQLDLGPTSYATSVVKGTTPKGVAFERPVIVTVRDFDGKQVVAP